MAKTKAIKIKQGEQIECVMGKNYGHYKKDDKVMLHPITAESWKKKRIVKIFKQIRVNE